MLLSLDSRGRDADGWRPCEHGVHADDCVICGMLTDSLLPDLGDDDDVEWHDAIEWPDDEPHMQTVAGGQDPAEPSTDDDQDAAKSSTEDNQDAAKSRAAGDQDGDPSNAQEDLAAVATVNSGAGRDQHTALQAPVPATFTAQDQSTAAPQFDQETVHCTFAHDAPLFSCPLCVFTSRHHGDLRRHRAALHHDVVFVERFHANCACSIVFPSRAAATKHAHQCSYNNTNPVTAATEVTLGREPALSCAPLSNVNQTPVHQTSVHQATTVVTTGSIRHREAVSDQHADDIRHVSERGKRRRLAPRSTLDNDDALMLPVNEPTPTSPPPHAGVTANALQQEHVSAAPSTPRPQASDQSEETSLPWLLHFDGACKRSRKATRAGAGAILTSPSNQAMWSCAIPLLSGRVTNNVAEYEGLLAGIRAAVSHDVRHLLIKGDSKLVINQVNGDYNANQPHLRDLRNEARKLLSKLGSYKLRYVDRLQNQVADRLANDGTKVKEPKIDCQIHATCTLPAPARSPTDLDATGSDSSNLSTPVRPDEPMPDADNERDRLDLDGLEQAEERERLDGDNAFHAAHVGHGSVPAKLYPLRLKQLTEEEWEMARAAVKASAGELVTLIRDAPDWATGETYLNAVPYRLRAVLAPYSSKPRRPPTAGPRRTTERSESAPDSSFQERLADAEESLARVNEAPRTLSGKKRRAGRRLQRIRKARARTQLRRRFQQHERECVEEILRPVRDPSSPTASTDSDAGRCPISASDLYEFFSGTAAPRREFDYYGAVGAEFREIIENYPTPTEAQDVLTHAISTDEIEDILQHVSPHSSPGLDGVGYAIYRAFGHELLPLLHAVFSFCWNHKRVPQLWKVGAVRLIYKRGDPKRPENWRPICLQPAIYKLYSGLLTRRLTRWLENNGLLPACQKGFRMMNGCHEHNFVATSLLDHAKRMHKQLYIVWYDLTNAFGSIPPELLWRVLAGMKMPSNFLQLLQDIYHDSFYTIINPADATATEPIRQETGVYQGCPMSPYLFLVAIAPLLKVLEAVPGAGFPLVPTSPMSCTAYADDLKVFSATASGIRALHEVVRKFLSWSTLRANPAKCALLQPSLQQTASHNQQQVKLQLQGDDIPAVSTAGGYRYLGVGDGMAHSRHQVQLDEKLLATRKEIDALMRSGLAPAQIFKAVKTYIYPQLDYALRHVRPSKAQLESFDAAFVRRVKHLLRLPRPASTHFIYTPTSQGGLGFLPLRQFHAALQISHAFQMLHSPDPTTRAIARAQAMQVIGKRYHLDHDYWTDRTDDAIMQFLNNSLQHSSYARRRRSTTDVGSLWTDVQEHLETYGLRFDRAALSPLTDATPLQLKVPHYNDWLTTTTILRRVKLHMKLGHFAQWKASKTQGRTSRVHGGHGSYFLSPLARVSDEDYRFAVRARLDQIETRSVLKRMKVISNDRCRHPQCNDRETLPHVLNHCIGTQEATRGRHDHILGQIATVLRKRLKDRHTADHQELLIDAMVPNLPGPQLKPDIQLLNHATKTATFVDLAITYEDQSRDGRDCSTLTTTKDKKIKKYSRLFRHYRSIGWKARVGALVYGALGSVLSSNFDTLTKLLGTTKREATRLNKRVSCEAIKGSKRIWYLHAGQHRQRQQQRRSPESRQRSD